MDKEFSKLTKVELLNKCDELGITKCKTKNKNELIEMINKKLELNKNEIIVNERTYEYKNNSKFINDINQLFHNKGVKQEDRFNVLFKLLDKSKSLGNSSDFISQGRTEEEIIKYKDILNIIDNLDYTNAELIQEIFMTIGSKYTKLNLDQFYTPLTISKFICDLMRNEEDYKAIDPAGGTGDLLLYYKGHKTIWDIDENSLKLCKFNYDLRKLNKYNLVCKNSLNNFEEYIDTYDYCVMNPPFGTNTLITDKNILNKYELGKDKSKQEIGILFLELGLKLLKEKGILFIIVPAGYVGNTNKVCSELRNLILKNRLIASISLPENTFKRSGTGVNTYLLIIQKKYNTSIDSYNVFISNMNNIGYNLTKKDTPLKYKIVKETGDYILNEDGNKILDNDFDTIYYQLSKFINDSKLNYDNIYFNIQLNNLNLEYEFVNTKQLVSNIIDIKRYSKNYTDVVNYLSSIHAVKLNTLCNIINEQTKIISTKLYKYIDISEINSPLYGYKELYGWELPSRAKTTLKKYDILISKLEGTMSYCVILDDNDNYISTNGVCVIRPNNINSLYIIFDNVLKNHFKIQHKAHLTGSIMASLSDYDISNFLIEEPCEAIPKSNNIETIKNMLDTLEKLQQYIN
jgi:hypothetical protein